MDHTAALRHIAATYFEASPGLSFEQLLAPVASDSPAGKAMRHSHIYRAIRSHRSVDDNSLPTGAWEHELKRADWPAVSRMTADVLRRQGKDIECVAWLFEARLHIDGFAAIAPCLSLVDALLNQYWDSIHPLPDGDDVDFRANQIRWIAEKLLPALRQTPMTASQDDTQYCWADWEQGQRSSHLQVRMDGTQELVESTELLRFRQAMAASSVEHFLQLHRVLSEALQALDMLRLTLDKYFAPSAPSLAAMAGLLEQIHGLCDDQLYRRGVRPVPASVPPPPLPPPFSPWPPPFSPPPPLPPLPASDPARDRDDAYARLAELGDYLLRIEPHSPATHLLRHVVELGKLNTSQLYQEVFLRSNGMLNVFELMGVDGSNKDEGS
jgi:type VI secretion system protein ImpA